MTAFLLWLFFWVPPVYCAGSIARRLTRASHLQAVIVAMGAMWYAYTACLVGILGGFTPGKVLMYSYLGFFVCLAWDFRSGRLTLPRLPWRRPSLADVPMIAGWLLISCLVGWLLWLGVRLPPHFADAAETHCVGPVSWYADRAFSWPVAGIQSPSFDTVNGYLKLPHLLFYYHAAASGGDAGYLSLAQFQALLLLLACCWALCRELELDRGAAMLSCLASLAVPETLVQVLDCYLDVLVASSLLAVILSCILVYKSPTALRLYGLAVAVGFAMAQKVTGPIQAAPLWLVFTTWGLWHMRNGQVKYAASLFAKCTAIVVALGGFWYIASWVRLGNPMHPFQISLGGRVVFPGITAYGGEGWLLHPKGLNKLTALPVSWGEQWPDYSLSSPYNGLGPLFLMAGLPAFFIMAAAAVVRRRWLHVVFALASIAVVALHPSAWQPRYSLLVASIGGVALAQLFQKSGVIFRSLLTAVTVAGVAAAVLHSLPYQVFGFYQPRAYFAASISSPVRAHLGSRGLLPDTNPVHQRLLLDPEFSGKRILIAPKLHIGMFVRPKMDSRILQCDDFAELSSFIQRTQPDYIYVTVDAGRQAADEQVLQSVRALGARVEELPPVPADQRLRSHYMVYGSSEHLFHVMQGPAQERKSR